MRIFDLKTNSSVLSFTDARLERILSNNKNSMFVTGSVWMRVALAVTLAALLVMAGFFTVDSRAAGRSGDFVKVGLRFQSSKPTAVLESPDGFALYGVSGETVTAGTPLGNYKKLELALSTNAVIIRDLSGNYIANIATDGSQIIASASYMTNNGYFVFEGKKCRGGIMPYINAAGQMNIIDFIDVEDYVKGVVSSEIGQNSHIETLKAQAVTTRSFAGANTGAHKNQGFDICSTAHCQVYSGVSAEYESTNSAVDATSGQMIYYEGKPVAAFYYANSGGYTENCEDVWMAPLGYLRSIKDEFSPEYKWEVKLTRAQITSALSSKNIGKVTDVSIDKVNPSGYVAAMTVTGTNSSVTVTKDPIRSIFKSAVSLKSRMFTLDTEGGILSGKSGYESPISEYFAFNKGSGIVRLDSNVNVISNEYQLNRQLDGMYILGSNNIQNVASAGTTPDYVSGGTHVKLNKDSDVLIISGKGFGHGVGMSQQGAQVMGQKGYSYMDILKYYYTGIDVR